MKKQILIDTFKTAQLYGMEYVGVAVETRGMEQPEYIINPCANIAQKLAYYEKAYDEEMVLKSYDGIRITRVAAAVTVEKLMKILEAQK